MIQLCFESSSFSSLCNGHFKLAVSGHFQKVVLQVSTCHVIAQKKLSSLVSGGRTQYKVH